MTKCILIVDDDADTRHILADALQEAGFAVATAVDGVDALDQVEQHPPDAILLDLIMPAMDGWSVLECLRTRARSRSIPVAIVSGAPTVLKTANEHGVQVAIGKPFALEALVEQVEVLCNPLT